MSKRVLILVEGQTEERFVKAVLAPVFLNKGLIISPTILNTKKLKDGTAFKGGVTSFGKFRNDMRLLQSGAGDALVTTMLDYYGLPADFPGMDSRPPNARPIERVTHIENAIKAHFGSPSNFIPFLALHEFEAWLFSSTAELPRVLSETRKEKEFAAVRTSVSNPEEINERPEFAPSKRILNLFPTYRKALHGPIIAGRIGLELIRSQCPHFNDWITKLETFAGS